MAMLLSLVSIEPIGYFKAFHLLISLAADEKKPDATYSALSGFYPRKLFVLVQPD